MNQQEEAIEVDTQTQIRCKICSEIQCRKCQQEIKREKIKYSLFIAGSATGSILSSIFLTYLSPGVFISSGLALGVLVDSIYETLNR